MNNNTSAPPGPVARLPAQRTRALLQPILLAADHLVGYWRSRNDANPRRARKAIGRVSPKWRRKIDDVLACPDNAYIPRVPEAGQLRDGLVTMHNGLQVSALGYYGGGVLNMLVENRGVHEPQEERAFGEILRCLPTRGTMLELGAYWGFYSMWFARTVADAACFLVEPSFAALRSGKQNFRRIGRQAHFEQAYVGACDGIARDGKPVVSVDGFCRRNRIDHLTILHADIQSAEADMLAGAREMLTHKRVDYVFISTHANALHRACLDALAAYEYRILVSVDLDESYAVDGLIVAKCAHIEQPPALTVSRKPRITHGHG